MLLKNVLKPKNPFFGNNTFAIFLKPLILRALRARKIKGFRKMASMLWKVRCGFRRTLLSQKWVF